MRILLSIIIGLQIQIFANGQTLPKEVQKCHFGDSDCIVDKMNQVIKNYPKGIPEIGLKPIDIVDIKNLTFGNGDRNLSSWITLHFFNHVNYGFENTTITKVSGFNKDPTKNKLEISGRIPNLVHKGTYFANGRLYLVELNCTGEMTTEFQNFTFNLKFKVIPEYRNNKLYIRVYELVPLVAISRWVLWMEDFFIENSDLTIAVNHVINKNWLEFWNELEPTLLEGFASAFNNIVEDIFNKVSYTDLFLPDD
ncbi:uncharacterized protein LOC115624307 [Scaptodrosophila lebanonensis]|uniref:Uncharacterized protein LOC115624307 n=1 Tax=Drosophila lebanonensis TaxID=7225 RepID=A0A6J2TFL4_DROLE|nr:uncharacterized protein LOC115624307 [Scaptodrosophila lebanonensis]